MSPIRSNLELAINMTDTVVHIIAVLGGTGKEGKGLAYRWAKKQQLLK